MPFAKVLKIQHTLHSIHHKVQSKRKKREKDALCSYENQTRELLSDLEVLTRRFASVDPVRVRDAGYSKDIRSQKETP